MLNEKIARGRSNPLRFKKHVNVVGEGRLLEAAHRTPQRSHCDILHYAVPLGYVTRLVAVFSGTGYDEIDGSLGLTIFDRDGDAHTINLQRHVQLEDFASG